MTVDRALTASSANVLSRFAYGALKETLTALTRVLAVVFAGAFVATNLFDGKKDQNNGILVPLEASGIDKFQ